MSPETPQPPEAPPEWEAFREHLATLRQTVSDACRDDAERLDIEMAQWERAAEIRSAHVDCEHYVSFHILAGSTLRGYAASPLQDFEGEDNVEAFLKQQLAELQAEK